MAADKNLKRRKYSAELKAQVVNECEAPGASVARVAMARGINANVVYSWRQVARTKRSAGAALTPTPAQFVPVVISSTVPIVAPASQAVAPLTPSPLTQPHIEVELRRGTTTLKLLWPATACAQLSAWTREVLA
ncbi:MAG: IS66-like element accessory protein TnpA [Burkholderiaceae bacterium]|jgi:transposase